MQLIFPLKPETCPLKPETHIIIIGASGDLTRRKLMPALFQLYTNDLLPEPFTIFGFARTKLDSTGYRELIRSKLTCRYGEAPADCESKIESFLERCVYHSGNYGSASDFQALRKRVVAMTDGTCANTILYMAIPPSIFLETATSIAETELLDESDGGWSRVVLEKPFGRDSASSTELLKALSGFFREDQTYRIDHYLGKEVIQNLLILRFANIIFEPVWNRNHVDHISISWGETIGCEGRAGYFDQYGIIRDVVQNHLIQMLALVAMEPPISLDAGHIADEKVKLLNCVPPIEPEAVVVGQYAASSVAGVNLPGYLDDDEVPNDSRTETFMKAVMYVNNPRWYGVPFHVTAGKALNATKTEIRVKFKDLPYSIFRHMGADANQLVIRIQPNEAIELHVVNKVPGLDMSLGTAALDLHYQSAFARMIPDAYERLLLEVLNGDQSLFLRADELGAAWDIVTPLLHELETRENQPLSYAYGSEGPSGVTQE